MKLSYQQTDTIAAIATPLGEGGIAVIRISGGEALVIANKIFSGPLLSFKSHTAHFGTITDIRGKKIDDGIALIMRAPRSYTGEDTVEIQCHGGMIGTRLVLESVIEAGARLAGPGEFTFRAFCNGKIDLTQAEAVQQLIAAQNERAFHMAGQHLEGRLSARVASFQKRVTDVAAILEAWVDFPEEGLEFASEEELVEDLENIYREMEALLHTFHEGRKVSEGISISIIGAPNAGKSSLLNALLGKERAIVSPQPGTTRDLVEDDFRWRGLHFRLIDTAGIRETDEPIEREGIRRSQEAAKQADLVFFVIDATQPAPPMLLDQDKTIFIWNKIDLPHVPIEPIVGCPNVTLSALQKRGFDSLFDAVDRLITAQKTASKEEVLLSSLRHKEALEEALESLRKVLEGFVEKTSPEFLTFDLRSTLSSLGKIIGKDVSEEILSSIFAKFCVGK